MVRIFGIVALLVMAGFAFASCSGLEGPFGMECDCQFTIGCDCYGGMGCSCNLGVGCACDNSFHDDEPWP